jgi:hypothetical protein
VTLRPRVHRLQKQWQRLCLGCGSGIRGGPSPEHCLAGWRFAGNLLRQKHHGWVNTVTVTFNQNTAVQDVRIVEYIGLDPTNPLDTLLGDGQDASLSSKRRLSPANDDYIGRNRYVGVSVMLRMPRLSNKSNRLLRIANLISRDQVCAAISF